MSDPTDATKDATAAATATDATTHDKVDDRPLGENGEKALRSEREARAAAERSTAALQKQLDDINAANLTELEKAQKSASDARADADAATSEALRLRVAAKHGINDADADLFLTGSDLETVERQATALAARSSNGPKPDLSQGAKGTTSSGSPEQDFANFLGAQMSGRG
ncbi:MAG: hypothetical protein LH630_05025 [Actinomycetia bacterium]|nr:hypothetical protein [Actinomycetes bacterium]